MSPKRASERDDRTDVRAVVLARDRGCVAAISVPEISCAGPLDVDEIVLRSGRPGGHLDPENCQTLCRAHHEWKHAHPADAHARGLRRWSWE